MKFVSEYLIEIWNDDGTLAQTYQRDVDWYNWPPVHPNGFGGEGGPAGPPEDIFLGAQFDNFGRLWVVARTTPDDWEAGVRGGRVVDPTKWSDFMIEVFDVGVGRSLCTRRLTGLYINGGFAASGVITSYAEDEIGRPSMTFWELGMRLQ